MVQKTVTLPPLQDLTSSEVFEPNMMVKLLLDWTKVGEQDRLYCIGMCCMELVE